MIDIPTIVRLIQKARVDLSNEKNAQAQLYDLLKGEGYFVRREVRLSARDIPDLMVFSADPPAEFSGVKRSGVAIEVKLKGAEKMAVFRQLTRYAKHDEVRALLLATSLSMGLPAEIEGKPAYYASLGRGWL